MTAFLTGWLRPLIAGALIVSLLLALAPEGKSRAPLRFASGVLMTLLLLRPLTGLDLTQLPELISTGLFRTEAVVESAAQQAEAVYDLFIRRETEEYIWNAAEALGFETLGVRAVLKEDAEEPVLWEICLRGSWTPAQRSELSRLLETELGVPPERQHWSNPDADRSEETAEGP